MAKILSLLPGAVQHRGEFDHGQLQFAFVSVLH